MKKNAITAVIVVLALILAGLIGLLVYLELDSRGPEATEPAGSAESTGEALPEETQPDAATDPENPLNTLPPAFTHETEGEEDATPVVPVQGVDPMDPQGATEGPEVDPELGADTPVDSTENELPIVEG